MGKLLIKSPFLSFLLICYFYFTDAAEVLKKLNEVDEHSLNGQQLFSKELSTFMHRQSRILQELTAMKTEINKISDLLSNQKPLDCSSAAKRGDWKPIVEIKPPDLSPRLVRCDQFTDGGGWTVVVQRSAEEMYSRWRSSYLASDDLIEIINFNKTWKEYKKGFGNTKTEYWIGNEVLHSLTKEGPWEAAVVVEDWDGSEGKAYWKSFRVLGEDARYRAEISGYEKVKSSIGDGLAYHSGIAFSTPDSDNDAHDKQHCAKKYGGGWWFRQCHVSLLTGSHLFPGNEGHHSLHWQPWKETKSLKSAKMMIRPPNF